MAKIVVTGGAGFIGSTFVRLMLEGHSDLEIIDIDALTYAGNLENINGVDETRHTFIRADICDREAMFDAIPKGSDAIFNFAAETHVDRSINSADEFLRTNVFGTQVLLDVARNKGVKRFIQISTDEVMGTLPEASDDFFREDSPLLPNSPYAASKAAAELCVRAARKTHGVDAVVTRCGNNYGPRQFPEKLIPLMIANALNHTPLPVYGDGMNVRDWIYVDDHARAVWLAYERGRSGEVYNVGARNQQRNIDVVRSLLDTLGKPHDLIKFIEDRPGHDRRYAIDSAKAESELGWKPQVSWTEGVSNTIRWYQDNQAWVEHIRSGEYRDYYDATYAARISNSK